VYFFSIQLKQEFVSKGGVYPYTIVASAKAVSGADGGVEMAASYLTAGDFSVAHTSEMVALPPTVFKVTHANLLQKTSEDFQLNFELPAAGSADIRTTMFDYGELYVSRTAGCFYTY